MGAIYFNNGNVRDGITVKSGASAPIEPRHSPRVVSPTAPAEAAAAEPGKRRITAILGIPRG